MFIAYRILLPLYLAGWVVADIVDRWHTDGAHWFIYITNWSFLLFVTAATMSAIVTVIFGIKPSKLTKNGRRQNHANNIDNAGTAPCNEEDNIHWIVKTFWVLYITSHTVTVMVCIGFWSIQYNPCTEGTDSSNSTSPTNWGSLNTSTGSEEDVENCGADILSIHAHGINAALATCDILLSLVPFNALHFLYPCIVTLNYVFFSGIYYAAGGKNESGDPYIYSLLNYGESLVRSIIAAILLIFLPAFIYVIPLLVACVRDRVYQWCMERYKSSRPHRRENGSAIENKRELNFSNPCTHRSMQ